MFNKNFFTLSFVAFCFTLLFTVVNADSQGANSFDVCSGWDAGTCTNARTNGGGYAATSTSKAQMKLSDYDFTIPADATIDGIVVSLDTWHSGFVGTTMSISLSKNTCSTTVGGAKTFNTTSSETTRNLGGSTDKWATTWTPAEINALTFCVRETTGTLSFGTQIREDFVRVTVYYTPAPVLVYPDLNILQPNGGEAFCSDASNPYTFIDANVHSWVDSDMNLSYWISDVAAGQDTWIEDWNVLNPDIPLFAEEFESLWDMNLNQVNDVNFVNIVSGYAGTNGADFNILVDGNSESALKYPVSYNDLNWLPLDNNTFTVEFWIKHSTSDYAKAGGVKAERTIFSTKGTGENHDRNSISLTYKPTTATRGTYNFYECEQGSCITTQKFFTMSYSTASINVWHHVALTFSDDSGKHHLYLNGVDKGFPPPASNADSLGRTLDIKPTGLYLGKSEQGNGDLNSFEGVIDRFVIYDWNKSAAEVLYDYENDLNFYVFPNDKNTGTKQVARYRWDYSGVTAGNYVIDGNLSETSSNFLDDFDSSDASFSVSICNPIIKGHIINPFYVIYAMPCYGAKILNNFLPSSLEALT